MPTVLLAFISEGLECASPRYQILFFVIKHAGLLKLLEDWEGEGGLVPEFSVKACTTLYIYIWNRGKDLISSLVVSIEIILDVLKLS